MGTHEWTRDGFVISTDRARVDVEVVHRFLQSSYWAAGIPLELVRRAVEHSLPFGVYRAASGEQVGFARVTTDFATFAYLADVFIDEALRGQGLGQWLAATIVGHPELQGLRRWLLATRDAHGLYAQHGFTPLSAPASFMEKWDPDVYRRGSR
ncbi:GNAT family N-acetyltransferase [Pyxidicoccus xibeiensis]|uniref:GNAT family N-acetyltransferase n=1 Tax=Pyxidicoccus xibeiensis TaxID=2906759 RepID=UPI0020A82107|nr:GNAT family N-acetyltransferase [Pyxidicoccus xibeiensis]MCP3142586.1 GNAT family N-acetyltransferase [Pyxidicoccus xibeiensis]